MGECGIVPKVTSFSEATTRKSMFRHIRAFRWNTTHYPLAKKLHSGLGRSPLGPPLLPRPLPLPRPRVLYPLSTPHPSSTPSELHPFLLPSRPPAPHCNCPPFPNLPCTP